MLLWTPEFPVLLGAEIVDKPPEDPGVAAGLAASFSQTKALLYTVFLTRRAGAAL